ncbi:MAG: glycosyltransferase family 1 protein, partial [Limnobacter sp.]|nr:glycosyltransferase family 1 protein [Limnobacter sp.]
MRILIVSDAWSPQVNGVVRTLQNTCARLSAMGYTV